MNIYIVSNSGPEHDIIESIHRTYEGALKSWDKLRKELLREEAQASLKREHTDKEMHERIIKNLSCEDPESIDNGPFDTPYITEYEVVE